MIILFDPTVYTAEEMLKKAMAEYQNAARLLELKEHGGRNKKPDAGSIG
jgi:hypothetical protein